MKRFNYLLRLFVAVSAMAFAASCEKETDIDPGSVFLRIVSTPDLEEYNDNNDCIPYNFNEGQEYGVCEPGTYTYSFKTRPNGSGNYWYLNGATYTIERQPGKRRVYTLSLGPTVSLNWEDQ
jgi:hypothetical protein